MNLIKIIGAILFKEKVWSVNADGVSSTGVPLRMRMTIYGKVTRKKVCTKLQQMYPAKSYGYVICGNVIISNKKRK